jgi:hypothetical protein
MVDDVLAQSLGFDSAWAVTIVLPEAIRAVRAYFTITSPLPGRVTSPFGGNIAGAAREVAKRSATWMCFQRPDYAPPGWAGRREYASLGRILRDRAKRMDGAASLRTLAGGKVISCKGKYYQFERCFSPGQSRPVVRYCGGVILRARLGCALCTAGPNTRPGCAARSRKLSGPCCFRPFIIAMGGVIGKKDRQDEPLSGSVDDIIEQLRAYQAAGMNYGVLRFPEQTHAARERSMRAFVQHVLPEL